MLCLSHCDPSFAKNQADPYTEEIDKAEEYRRSRKSTGKRKRLESEIEYSPRGVNPQKRFDLLAFGVTAYFTTMLLRQDKGKTKECNKQLNELFEFFCFFDYYSNINYLANGPSDSFFYQSGRRICLYCFLFLHFCLYVSKLPWL